MGRLKNKLSNFPISEQYMFILFKKIWHSFIIFALAIVFSYSLFFLFLHPLNLAFFLGERLSAEVGITNSASVPLNPINQLALQLDEKEKQLSAKEQALNDQTAELAKRNSLWNNGMLLAIFSTLIILGILIVINFYFDRKREKELEFLEKIDAERTIEDETKNN
jgi:hypothetical protein